MTENEPTQLHRLETLVRIVQNELVAAGLRVIPDPAPTGMSGAIVAVRRPELDGVLVSWQLGPQLVDAAHAAWGDDPHHEHEECAAFAKLRSAIDESMAKAMLAILAAGGLEAARIESCDLLVTQRLAVSPWQARRTAEFEARYEKMLAAWNARNAENCPKPDCDTHQTP
ncbi:hypothetical protein [Amycolatopsis sp. NPDC004079]|uniref:hypothetical protein n=1 Tax=Amycolatopsis sp. NPDC004079 TaxID=3154549 RepID=UPI0033BCD681